MVKKLLIIFSFLIILIIPTSILKITNDEIFNPQFVWIKNKDDNIGKLVIKKINLNENIYDISSSKNNVEEHVTILKESTMPDKVDSTLILAAHSGTGSIAYFNDLDKLNIDDEIILYYKDKKYSYIVNDIWEERKNGYIHINKEDKRQLILTTCSPNKDKYQLIINCTEKESN